MTPDGRIVPKLFLYPTVTDVSTIQPANPAKFSSKHCVFATTKPGSAQSIGCTFLGSEIAASESTQRGSYMFKFVFSAFVCAAMCFPAASFAQDCGCGCEPAPAPCVKTRKRLKLVDVQKEVCRLKRVCTTDECGCSKSKLVRVKECVTRKSSLSLRSQLIHAAKAPYDAWRIVFEALVHEVAAMKLRHAVAKSLHHVDAMLHLQWPLPRSWVSQSTQRRLRQKLHR